MTNRNVSLFLPFELGYLTEEIKAKAENELGETDEIRKKSLIQMRKLVKEEPKLFCADNDGYLLIFLRARKFNVKAAFGALQIHYHVKKSYPDVYGRTDFQSVKKCFTDKVLNLLPYRDEEGCVILLIQAGNLDMDGMYFTMFIHSLTCALLLCVEDPATQVCGIKIIVDVSGIGIRHIRYFHPKYLALIARGLRHSIPMRFRAIHFVNESSFFYYFWNFISLPLSDKIRNRVIFHNSNIDGLKMHFNPELLPKEYGGHLRYDNTSLLKKIETKEKLYEVRMSYGYRSETANTKKFAA